MNTTKYYMAIGVVFLMVFFCLLSGRSFMRETGWEKLHDRWLLTITAKRMKNGYAIGNIWIIL